MPAGLIIRGVVAVAKPVAQVGNRVVRALLRRPLITAATAATGAVAVNGVDNPIPEIAQDVEAGAANFAIGAGVIFGGYLIAREVRARRKRLK